MNSTPLSHSDTTRRGCGPTSGPGRYVGGFFFFFPKSPSPLFSHFAYTMLVVLYWCTGGRGGLLVFDM